MTKSEQINELAAALVKVQAEMKPAMKNKQNPFFKSMYADHVSVMEASRPMLSKNGLCITQSLGFTEGKCVLETFLIHVSGQFMSSIMPLTPAKADAQSFGSYLSYMRRYAEMAIIGLAAEDDDGEGAMTRKADKKPDEMDQTPPEDKKTSMIPDKDQKKISEAQGKRLFAIAGKANWSNDELRRYLQMKTGQASTKLIPWTAYEIICDYIETHPKAATK